MEMAAMAAQLVPSPPSLPQIAGNTGKGKLFQEVGEGPGLNLLSMKGFHWDQWYRASTQAGWTALGSRRGPCATGSATPPDTSPKARRLVSLRGTISEPSPSPEHIRCPGRHRHLAPSHPSLPPSSRARTVPAR